MKIDLSPVSLLSLILLAAGGCGGVSWVHDEVGDIHLGPVVQGDRLILQVDRFGVEQEMVALDSQTGIPVWSQQRVGQMACSSLVADTDLIFVACGDHVAALDGASGRILWRVQIPGLVQDDLILHADGLLVRVALEDRGKVEVTREGPSHGTVVGQQGSARVVPDMFNSPALPWRWNFEGGPAYAWLFMTQGDVLGSGGEPEPAPLPPQRVTPEAQEDGEIAWPHADDMVAPPPPPSMEEIDQEKAQELVLDPEGSHVALFLDRNTGGVLSQVKGPATGALLWQGDVLAWITPSEVVGVSTYLWRELWRRYTTVPVGMEAGATLYSVRDVLLLASEGQVEAININSGTLAWTLPTEGRSSPQVWADGLVLLQRGEIQRIDLRSGAVLWAIPAPGLVETPQPQGEWLLSRTVTGTAILRRISDGHEVWRMATGVKGAIFHGEGGFGWIEGDQFNVLAPTQPEPETCTLPPRKVGPGSGSVVWSRGRWIVARGGGRIVAVAP